jgi:hypothetical protein
MINKRNIIKNVLLGILLFILVVPFLQNLLNLVTENSLKENIQLTKDKTFSFTSWFNGIYQKRKDNYLNQSFGFRNTLVRLNNQLFYSLFNEIHANGVVEGKNKYFYEAAYIKAYYGLDFIGQDSILHRMEKLKFIQDTLISLKKNIILVFAASKGSFYPEYFPEKYSKTKRSKTNLGCYIHYSEIFGIPHINFDNYFAENKFKSKYPLFPQYGDHWSQYGTCLAADSIIKYIEKLRNSDLPNFCWNEVDLMEPHDVDYDIANAMNLLVKFKSFKMAYPKVYIENNHGKSLPSILVISDSFFWGMYNYGISKCFGNMEFKYYNTEIYPESYNSQQIKDESFLKKEILSSDIIVIMGSTATLPNFGWKFIENTYDLFKNPGKYDASQKCKTQLEILREKIYADPEWLKKIEKKADDKGISLDSMVTLDALWLIKNNYK